MMQLKKMAQRGLLDPEREDPFALFVASTPIRYCYYAEAQSVLGQTFGCAVLQDFEALTPNLLARTVETVEGGGMVVLLVSTLRSLRQLYTLAMDVHARLRTESAGDATPRFNERLVLSLASCPTCLLVDDELNVLPTSSLAREIAPLADPEGARQGLLDGAAPARRELAELAASLADTQPAGALVARCRTLDQARGVVTFLDAASEKTLRATVALTAARGRGKSAALGLAVAGCLASGYANVFVTAPSAENLRTLFEFVVRGLDALGWAEHTDYDLVQSSDPAMQKALVRVNAYRSHRQTVQYVTPGDAARGAAGPLAQAELLVIDEAAAIPLPMVRAMLGPYLVFLCSTVNGYEGTGRSLSLKLIAQLREQAASAGGGGGGGGGGHNSGRGSLSASSAIRTFREVQLTEPIRYAPGDPVEAWLNGALCLDAAGSLPAAPPSLPPPGECELYVVNRDTLFSFHRASEALLQRIVALLSASHYKNTPNDLLLMADAPAHRLFVLLGPVDEARNALPDVLAVCQVALEGRVSAASARAALARGELPQGDLLPWTVAQQFQDADFPRLSGARVVRLATHPELARAGYGSRVLELLRRHYQGELRDLDEDDDDDDDEGGDDGGDEEAHRDGGGALAEEGAARRLAAAADAKGGGGDGGASAKGGGGGGGGGGESLLTSEELRPRAGLPPLLVRCGEARPRPPRLHYLGVSYGLTQPLYNFWSRAGYLPLYVRQTASDVTGEHTVVMVRPLEHRGIAPSGGGQAAAAAAGTVAAAAASSSSWSSAPAAAWLAPFVDDFRSRFASLLSGPFRLMPPALALSVLDPRLTFSDAEAAAAVERDSGGGGGGGGGSGGAHVSRGDGGPLTPHDLRRLHAYASNLADYHLVADLLPSLAAAYLRGRVPATLSYGQAAILASMGLQRRELGEVAAALGLPSNQVLALFNKALRKLHGHLRAAKEAAVARDLPLPALAAGAGGRAAGGSNGAAAGAAAAAAAAAAASLPAVDAGGGYAMDAELEAAAAEERRRHLDPEALLAGGYAVRAAAGDDELAEALGGAAPAAGARLSLARAPGSDGDAKKKNKRRKGGEDDEDDDEDDGAAPGKATLYKKKHKGGKGGGGDGGGGKKKHHRSGGGGGGKKARA
jgi:N-acetyltransferase 10